MKSNISAQEELSTKQRFAYALLELMDTVSFSKISISAIVEKSGISRATFYRHFVDKNNLLSWIHLNLFMLDAIAIDGPEDWHKKLTVVCQSLKDNQIYYKKAFAYMEQNSLLETMAEHSDQATAKDIMRIKQVDELDETLMYAIQHFGRGNVQMWYKWVMAGTPGSASHMADLMMATIPVVLTPYMLSRD